MSQYIYFPFALTLLIAVGWTTLFSLSISPAVRGYRNYCILACYVLALYFLFAAGWRSALVTWMIFGFAGGTLYLLSEILQYVRAPRDGEKPPVSLSSLVHGLYAWPIMVPEAIENSMAELGILKTTPTVSSASPVDVGAKDDVPSISNEDPIN